ncbi:MAG: hypothetical protein JWN86_1827 [Planctomycetota bacterium]|nr:hypothetical protein [Planctomycetota bacterium]
MGPRPLPAERTAVEFDVVIRYIDEEHAAAFPYFTNPILRLSDWTRAACEGMDEIRPLARDDARILISHPRDGDQVQMALEAAGFRVGRVDSRARSRGRFIDPAWLSRQGHEDRDFLAAIAPNRHGCILAAGVAERARPIALVAEAPPRVPIAVALGSRDAAAAFRLRLGRRTSEPIGLDLDGNSRMYRRIAVGRLASVRCSGGQVVFIAEGEQVLARHGEEALLACRDGRRYGSFGPGASFSAGSRARIAEASGPAIYDSPPMRVAARPFTSPVCPALRVRSPPSGAMPSSGSGPHSGGIGTGTSRSPRSPVPSWR